MVPVESEGNIEVLRHYTLWLQSQVKELHEEITKLRDTKEASKQEWLEAKLRDQLSRLQKRFYGHGRESLVPREDRPVGHKQEKLNLHSKYPQEGKEIPKAGFKPQGPVIYTYKMSERELKKESVLRCLKSGSEAWDLIDGLYQKSTEITVFERVYQEVLHRQCKYRLKAEYNDSDKEILITAPGPVKIRPQSRYSMDFAVSVVIDKYQSHLPLERQRRVMESLGLEIDTKTLYGLCEAVASHGDSIKERIRQNILADFCAAHLDETPWPIKGQDSQSYMWALSNRRGSYYQFEPTRSGKIGAELLKNYSGSLITDGYGGYNWANRCEELRHGLCWSHARREYHDRIKDFPQAVEAVEIIDKLFAIEAKAGSFEELKNLRKTKSTEVTKELYQWMCVTMPKYLKEEGINQAIRYSMNNWKGLTLFLGDLSLPLSNNDVERGLRHIVLGRNNFGGSKTINGADTAATLYTVIESTKKVGLQPTQYLKYLIEERWYGEVPKTPYELAMEKLGPNKKIIFPEKHDWKI